MDDTPRDLLTISFTDVEEDIADLHAWAACLHSNISCAGFGRTALQAVIDLCAAIERERAVWSDHGRVELIRQRTHEAAPPPPRILVCAAEARLRGMDTLTVKLWPSGDAWCAQIGTDIVAGRGGFGPTCLEALRDLCRNLLTTPDEHHATDRNLLVLR